MEGDWPVEQSQWHRQWDEFWDAYRILDVEQILNQLAIEETKGLADTGAKPFSPGTKQISSPRQWNEGHRRAIFKEFCYLLLFGTRSVQDRGAQIAVPPPHNRMSVPHTGSTTMPSLSTSAAEMQRTRVQLRIRYCSNQFSSLING
jgi:hypothetical protein